jgi:16S rRNA (cytosine967-C5)-methyltransferase
MNSITSRSIALQTLSNWHGTGAPVPVFFERCIDTHLSSSPERALARAIIGGILRHLEYLDLIIESFSHSPLKKMKTRTLFALRMGIYQLLFMDRIPPSAAVNETVKSFKEERQPQWLVRVVNGILRNVARNLKNIPASENIIGDGQPVLNHPSWLLSRWQKRFGDKIVREICRQNNLVPPLTLRVNTKRISRNQLLTVFLDNGYDVEKGRFSKESLIMENSGAISALPGYEEGYFLVQDEAAQLVSMLMPMVEHGNYLDGCAGLGGKTSHLASLVPVSGKITALEPDRKRYRQLGENLHRLGLEAKTIGTTLEEFAESSSEKFDGILIDAPCSGTGVIRRQPDIRWNRNPDDFNGYQQQQLDLLTRADSLLKENGSIVYATCSLEAEENEEVIEKFMAKHPEYIVENGVRLLPDETAKLINQQGMFISTPADGLDGFFAVRIVR